MVYKFDFSWSVPRDITNSACIPLSLKILKPCTLMDLALLKFDINFQNNRTNRNNATESITWLI